jgi:biopolymer transport protein ExbB
MDVNLLKEMVDYGIIGLLGFMSFLTVWFWIERLLYFRSIDLKTFTCKQELEIALTNHTSILSTFGSNAPYIGLLGTVVAIIITFYTLGIDGDIDVKQIMTSLALALKATAMGFLVAIPAIFFYNHLVRKIEVMLTRWEIEHANKKV